MSQNEVRSWLDRLRQQKLFSASLLVFTLAIAVLLGTALTTGVSAAKGQATAPDATALTIPPVKLLSNDFTKLAKLLEPSVVFISTDFTPKQQTTAAPKRRNPHTTPTPQEGDDEEGGGNMDQLRKFFGMPFGGDATPRKRESSGSGFIVDKNGYIITNFHVVEQADHIKVKLTGDKAEYKAKLIGTDEETDVAIIKIDTGKPLQPIKIANSDSVQVGDWAVAIGAPFGLETSVTAGIVSATGRDIARQFQRFIQTDAAINPGNSGGPLVNINGEVIGINTMIATQSGGYQGIGFALPMNTATKVYNQVIQNGRVARGSIGISFPRDQGKMENTLKALGFKHGVIIEFVTKGGPAEKAGIKDDDVVLALNGKAVKDGDDLVGRVSDMPLGSDATITIDRDGKTVEKKVTIEDREKVFKDDPRIARNRREMTDPEDTKGSETTAKFGVGIRAITEEQRKELGFENPGGVLVTVVEEGSFAEEIGVKERDVIVSINRQPVSSFEDVKRIQGKLKSGDAVAFKVLRAMPGTRRSQTWTGSYLSGTLPPQ